MVDILQVMEGATYTAFIVGAIVAVYELRTMSRDRKTDLMMRTMETFANREFEDALYKVFHSKSTDAKGLEDEVTGVDLAMVGDALEYLAFLARRNLIDKKMIIEFYPAAALWKKMRPWVIAEKAVIHPELYGDFEWLAKLEESQGVPV